MESLRDGTIAEFIGTLFLVTVAISSTILPMDLLGASIPLTVLINALAVAFVLFALIESLAPISGAHFNPAVTLAFLLSGDIPRRRASAYITAQMLGGIIGVIFAHLMFYDTTPILLTMSENSMNSGQYLAEVIGTFLLVGVIIACARGRSKHLSLTVGLLVGGMIVATSSTMFANPAVTFGRMFTYAICGIAVESGVIFMLAEVLGAMVAVGVFAYVLYPGVQPSHGPVPSSKKDDVPKR